MSTGTLADKPIGPIGFGLMGMTWRPQPPPTRQSFQTLRASLAIGANFWNAGELYGTPERNSCHLLNEYFTQYPDDASKVVLSIKGGTVPGQMNIDGSETNIRRSVDECLRVLDGKKSIDIFECARVDQSVPIETQIATLAALVHEGKIGAIGLSEVKASTIHRAAAAAKEHGLPIAAVEVELSLWSTDILHNDIAKTCGGLDIPIVAYSPLSRGALTGDVVRKNADIPVGDMRKHMPKFQDDVLDNNNKLTDEVEKLAARKGCTKPQIAIAWVRGLSGRTVAAGTKLGRIIPIPGATTEERVRENTKVVELSDEEMEEIAAILRANPISGDRYPAAMNHLSDG